MNFDNLILEIMAALCFDTPDEYAHTSWIKERLQIPNSELPLPKLHHTLQTLRAIGLVELKPGTESKKKAKWWRPTKFYRELAKRLISDTNESLTMA